MSSPDYDLDACKAMTAGWNQDPQKYLDRYYDCYIHKKLESVYLRRSPNELVVMGLRSLPPTDNITVELEMDLIKTKVSPGTMVARINNEPVFATVHGTLLELNQRLLSEPSLLVTDPIVQGFIAIIMPKQGQPAKILHEFIQVDQL
ncbi:uncharacterized protein BX664DRAFT_331591 [Halteromyces radiatus]|uniref:uncharacterized protein n=1 Tax=Halteromyces radiatus TaxID=101107 RepID=UPI0022201D02|nr:uncharacterized protein BX664DRAFT_331591 [Halteromyces radiatus]KAI8088863.1 hypothetical protein BX664DRAFT_331591 [Halteromyces radiatus]